MDPDTAGRPPKSAPAITKWVWKLVVLAAIMVVLVYFVADNFVIVEVRLFGIHRPIRLAWLILLTFAFGAVAGAASLALWTSLRRR